MVDLRRLPARNLYWHVQALQDSELDALLDVCNRASKDEHSLRSPTVRERIASILWAGYPRSRGFVEEILRRSRPSLLVDVHHKLFCAADEMLESEPRQDRAHGVIALVEQYLQRTRSPAHYAAWQAGDFLGAHCPLRLGVPALCRLVVHADHAAGRLGALHGMAHAMARLERGRRSTTQAVAALRRVPRQRPGSEEACEAERILNGWRCLE